MVNTRRGLQRLWTDRCTIHVKKEVVSQVNKRTTFVDEALISDEPCRLSFETLNSTNEFGNAASLVQKAKLFIAPEVLIPPGSKISVTRNGVTIDYEQSGEPGLYDNHQEIMLELFKGWA